jgi:hypothetical protein
MQVLEPRFEAGVYTTAPWIGLDAELEHHYDANGNHQLQYKGRVGDWKSFAEMCSITIKDQAGEDRTFCATTKYHWPEPEIFEKVIVVPRY